MKPNFFIIGAPRCGTTALCEYLRENPNIFLSTPKEPHYFDFDFKHRKMDFSTYQSLFSKVDPKVHKAIGEATTSYLHSDCAVPEILRFNPEAKLIVMLRNPLELVQTRHAYNLFVGRENIRDVEEAWRAEADRKKGEKLPFGTREPKMFFYSDWGKLGERMEKLFSRVDRNQVKVILFDDFVADTHRIYDEVLAFLNVPCDGRTHFPKINENRKVHSLGLQKHLAILSKIADTLKTRLNVSWRLGLLSWLYRFNVQFGPRKDVSENFRKELKAFYQDDVKKLSKILSRDLTFWITFLSYCTGCFLSDFDFLMGTSIF